MSDETPLLEVSDFALSFSNGSGPRIQAVDGASLTVYPEQTVAVVGESGCGKSVTAMSMMGLVPTPPARVDRGTMMFESASGRLDLLSLDAVKLRAIRGGEIAMIFQEPMTSLNPVLTVGDQILEAIRMHRGLRGNDARAIAVEALTEVGIRDPERGLRSYPHEYSGGMRQRAMIAMALSCRPRLLIADEPTTALDVTIQKQILDLITDLRSRHAMAVLLITHDLGVVAEQADVVCVMYAGRVVEYAETAELYQRPLHPYTRALLACIPSLDRSQPTDQDLTTISAVTGDEAEWRRLAAESHLGVEDLRPWWVWHDAPDGVDRAEDSRLVEVGQGHWVRVWATPGAREAAGRLGRRQPSLAARRRRALPIGEGHAVPPAHG
ncbi:MAG: ABC transporter ATP-binding protein [Planctomycetota bacterium]